MAQPPPPGTPPGPPYGPYGSGPFGAPPQPPFGSQPPYGQPGGYYPPPPMPQKSGGSNAVWIIVALGAFALLSCGILAAVGFAVAQKEEAQARAEETNNPSKSSRSDKTDDDDKPVEAPKPSSVLLDPFNARDGRSQIRPAVGWTELPELHTEASIEWGNKAAEEYLIVISEPRANFDSSLNVDKFADIHITRMRGVITNMEVKGPKRLTLNGNSALQYEVLGSVDFVRIGYLISYVEGKKAFHQVLTWTLIAQFEDKKGKFATVMDSFREL